MAFGGAEARATALLGWGATALFALLALGSGLGCREAQPAVNDMHAAIGDAALHDDGGAGAAPHDAGGAARDGGTCEVLELHREPGAAVSLRSATGDGACAGKTLGALIDAVHGADASLDDITLLFDPDALGLDQSFIYAFREPRGGFALVFRRGGGDCPAGCTENEYWYFRTDATCAPVPVGHYGAVHDSARDCLAIEGFPLWDHPPPIDPLVGVCDFVDNPWVPLGPEEQALHACGQRVPCARESIAEALAFDLRFSFAQDRVDRSRGMLTLHNTGHRALDERPHLATIARRRIRVSEHVGDLPAVCREQHDLEIVLDFDGHADSFLHFEEVGTPDCAGAPDDYCKGELHLDLGNLAADGCSATIDLQETIDRQRGARGQCTQDADCAAVPVEAACLSECPVAVRVEQVDAFKEAIAAAGDAYCAEPTACGRDDDCSAAIGAQCRDGRCEPRFR